MSDDSVLDRHLKREGDSLDSVSDGSVDESSGAFGFGRGPRHRAGMLELRKKTGSILALSYSWIERIEYDPSSGITIYTAGQPIRLKGRNLNQSQEGAAPLFVNLARQRVLWVQEASSADAMTSDAGVCIVEEIQW